MSRYFLRWMVGCGTAVGTFGGCAAFAEGRKSRPLRGVVVGGGCAGATLAQSLEHIMNITLVDKTSYFEYTPALKEHLLMRPPQSDDPKELSEDEKTYFRKNFITHRFYLRHSDIVISEVKEITPTEVILKDDRRIAFDRCFVCTGSKQPAPWRQSNCVTVPQRAIEMNKFRNLIAKSNNIAIIGGGATGCEYAAYLAEGYPDKKVTLYHSKQSLVPSQGERITHYVNRYLLKKGTTVNRLSRVTNLSYDDKTKKFTVEWKAADDKGDVIDERIGGTDDGYDYVFDCRGIVPATQILEKHFKSSLNDEGFAIVDSGNRLIGTQNVYALGDIAIHPDAVHGKESSLPFIIDDVLRVSTRFTKSVGTTYRRTAFNSNDLHHMTYPTQFISLGTDTKVGHAGASGQLTYFGNWAGKGLSDQFLNTFTSPTFRPKLKDADIFKMRINLEECERNESKEGR